MEVIVNGQFYLPGNLLYRLDVITQCSSEAQTIKRRVSKVYVKHDIVTEDITTSNRILSAYGKMNRARRAMKKFIEEEFYEAVEFDEVEKGTKEWKQLMKVAEGLLKEFVWCVHYMEVVLEEEGKI